MDVQCQAIAFKTEDQASACMLGEIGIQPHFIFNRRTLIICVCIVYRQIGLCITNKTGLFKIFFADLYGNRNLMATHVRMKWFDLDEIRIYLISPKLLIYWAA